MPTVELTRPLEHYFAFAELERHGKTRRFTITLPYLIDRQLDRLQWWWRVSLAEESLIGADGMTARRAREIERFRRHIEGWLASTGQRLCGNGPIPELNTAPADAPHAFPLREGERARDDLDAAVEPTGKVVNA
jgi:hypothetical protein